MITVSVYQQRAKIAIQIAEKRKALRQIYGGMMSPTDLDRELGFKHRGGGTRWAAMMGIEPIMRSEKRKAYETDRVAEAIVRGRLPA